MKFSSNTRYAIRLLFELHGFDTPVSIALLSEKTGISPRAIENIHAVLRQNGVTVGTVGAKGGLELARPLTDVSLGDIVSLFDGGVAFSVCCGKKANACPNQDTCQIRAAWTTIGKSVQDHLDTVDLYSILCKYPQDREGFLLNKFLGEDMDLSMDEICS